MPHFICVTCATQYAATEQPPPACPVCEDPRQYVGRDGQRWTTLEELARDHALRIAAQGDLVGVGVTPSLGIGQRALLVPWGETNLLWDCVGFLDAPGAAEIERRGGIGAIAISHPHYYSAMAEWAQRFDCPIHLPRADAEWIMRPDPRVRLWDGDRLELGHRLTLHRVGAHFPGAAVLHQAAGSDGRGTLLSGDMPLPAADRRWVSFQWSYPNRIPLPGAEVRRVAAVLAALDFATLHGGFWDTEVTDASNAVARSARRYVDALEAVPASHPPATSVSAADPA